MYVFTDRVELEDQAYRWYYDIKYGQDKTGKKGNLIFGAVVIIGVALMAILIPEEKSAKWPAIWFLLALSAYFILRDWVITRYKYRKRGWTCRKRYELDAEKVKVFEDDRTTEDMEKVGRVIETLDVLSGGPLTHPDMTGEEAYSVCELSKVKKAILDPAAETIMLRQGSVYCRLFVPAEDYDLVKDFILGHIKDSAQVVSK